MGFPLRAGIAGSKDRADWCAVGIDRAIRVMRPEGHLEGDGIEDCSAREASGSCCVKGFGHECGAEWEAGFVNEGHSEGAPEGHECPDENMAWNGLRGN